MFYTVQNMLAVPTTEKLDSCFQSYFLVGTLAEIRNTIFDNVAPEKYGNMGTAWQRLCYDSNTNNPTRDDWLEHIGLSEDEIAEENEAGGTICFPERDELTVEMIRDMASDFWDIPARHVHVYDEALEPVTADILSLTKTLTGFSLEEFSRALNVSSSSLRNWITGRSCIPCGVGKGLGVILREEIGHPKDVYRIAENVEKLALYMD